LTWNEGETVQIDVLSDTQFRMVYVGKTYSAELRSDGKLYWSDGDRWSRQSIPHTVDLSARTDGSQDRRSTGPVATAKISPGTLSTGVGKVPSRNSSSHDASRRSHPEVILHHENEILSEQPGNQPRVNGTSYKDLKFDGVWGPAYLKEGNLTWNEGETVQIDVLSDTQFRMVYVGKTYSAELRSDGKLYWSDGDRWSRQSIPHTVDLSARTDGSQDRRSTGPVATAKISPSTLSTGVGKVPNRNSSSHDASRHSHPEATLKRESEILCEQPGNQPRVNGTSSSAAVVTSAHARPNNSSQHVAHRDKTTTTDSRKAVPEVVSSTSNVGQSKGHAVVVSEPIDERKYVGRVSWFRGSHGWVRCEEIAANYGGLDAFLHNNDCDVKPSQGDEVEFRLALDNRGNPKAVKVQQAKAREVIDARDWFALRQRR